MPPAPGTARARSAGTARPAPTRSPDARTPRPPRPGRTAPRAGRRTAGPAARARRSRRSGRPRPRPGSGGLPSTARRSSTARAGVRPVRPDLRRSSGSRPAPARGPAARSCRRRTHAVRRRRRALMRPSCHAAASRVWYTSESANHLPRNSCSASSPAVRGFPGSSLVRSRSTQCGRVAMALCRCHCPSRPSGSRRTCPTPNGRSAPTAPGPGTAGAARAGLMAGSTTVR